MPVSSAIPTSDEPGGIVWKLPAGWTPAPNPSPMRLATYKPTPDAEVSVSRAGGATDANIQRWVGQFKDASTPVRTQKTVSSLHVEEVFVTGTFGGGGMMPGAASGDHPGWALLGAIVETAGSHYFFKMTGPVAQVQSSRAGFDALLASITPSK